MEVEHGTLDFQSIIRQIDTYLGRFEPDALQAKIDCFHLLIFMSFQCAYYYKLLISFFDEVCSICPDYFLPSDILFP